MNGLPYYKAYPRDFIEGTIGMPFEVKCAYRVVLDLIYMQGGDLPDDARYISGHLGCSIRKWKAIREALIARGEIRCDDRLIISRRLDAWAEQSRKDSARPAIPAGMQDEVFERDGGSCVYCGATSGPFHLDHIYPWARGGDHSVENLTVACAKCNWSKGSKTLAEWRGF